jgi:hypothetical protein
LRVAARPRRTLSQTKLARGFARPITNSQSERYKVWSERIFGATIFFGTDRFSGRATMVQRSRFNFMREAQIWYSRDHPDQRPLSSEFENIIVLSDEFYQELIAHPLPNDLEAVKVLAASSTFSCGFLTDVSPPKARNRYRCSGTSGSLIRSARRTTRGLADSEPWSNNGLTTSAPSGQSARHGLARTDRRSR